MLWRARGSCCEDDGTTWFFSSCGGILELRRGFQASSCVGPGKPKLPFELRAKAGGCARVTAGPKRPHLGMCPGPNSPLMGRQGSRGRTPDSTWGVRLRLEGKHRTVLSSRAMTRSPSPRAWRPDFPGAEREAHLDPRSASGENPLGCRSSRNT